MSQPKLTEADLDRAQRDRTSPLITAPGGAVIDTTRRYPRSLADAFPDVRRRSLYLDTSLRARAARALRSLFLNLIRSPLL